MRCAPSTSVDNSDLNSHPDHVIDNTGSEKKLRLKEGWKNVDIRGYEVDLSTHFWNF